MSDRNPLKQYTVQCHETCTDCAGTGVDPLYDEAESDPMERACFGCGGTGRSTREVSLAVAMNDVENERQKDLDRLLQWHRYADVDVAAGTWGAHNAAAVGIARILTDYEPWKSPEDLARGLVFIPHMTFHGVRVVALDEGTLSLDVEGKHIMLYNRDDRVGEDIGNDLRLGKAWRGQVGEFGVLRLLSFGWSFVTYPERHSLMASLRTTHQRTP
jgi:hypothetical protein